MLSLYNKIVYICLLLMWGIMSSAGVYAANAVEPSHAATVVVRADRRTGRLVRSVIVNPKVIPPKANEGARDPASVSEMVEQAAKSYDVDPLLVHSVIQVESNYNPYAISNKGAEGLMQLIPATARRFGATNSFSPRENIEAGVRYLKYLKNIFGDDRLALAAYNAGEGAVARYGWVPPYAETQQYVNNVGRRYGEARRKAAAQPTPAQAAPVTPAVDEHPKLEQYRDEQGRVYLRTR
jgi:soluble lytic murein transglycosylase-like protein